MPGLTFERASELLHTTTTEPHLPAEFVLSDPEKHTYRCAYCDSEYHR